jgi:hypothetical protein
MILLDAIVQIGFAGCGLASVILVIDLAVGFRHRRQ